jgi:hypothetical protein
VGTSTLVHRPTLANKQTKKLGRGGLHDRSNTKTTPSLSLFGTCPRIRETAYSYSPWASGSEWTKITQSSLGLFRVMVFLPFQDPRHHHPLFFPRIKDDPTLFSVASHVSTNFSGPLSVSVYSPLSPLYTVCCALTHKSYYYSIEALGPRPNLFTPTPPHLIWRSCHLYNKIVGKHGAGAHDDADTE